MDIGHHFGNKLSVLKNLLIFVFQHFKALSIIFFSDSYTELYIDFFGTKFVLQIVHTIRINCIFMYMFDLYRSG